MSEPTRMSGLEALFLRMDRRSDYQHTLKIAIIDPSTDPDGWSFERYRALVLHQLSVVPLLRQRCVPTPLGLHQPIWADDPDFDLDAQLRLVACPGSGGMHEFCRLVEQVYCHPLDHGRPLWQVWAVEGLEGGRVALLALIHHAYADGAGMRAILDAMLGGEPSHAPSPGLEDWDVAPVPSVPRRVLWALRDLPAVARSVPPAVESLRERVRVEREFAARAGHARPSGADRRKQRRFGGRLSRARRFACHSASLDEMQDVRAALGGTINDVFLCCVAGSVRAFLLARGMPCASPLPSTMPLTVTPADERPRLGGNYSAADDVWLHSDIADPLKRYQATRASAQATKEHSKAVGEAHPLGLLDLIPGPAVSGMLWLNERTGGRLTPVCDTVVSNVRGPDEPLYLGRWRLDRWFSIGQLWPGNGLNFTAWSYAGQFNVSVLADARRVPDAWELIGGFDSALQELVSIARGPTEERTATAAES